MLFKMHGMLKSVTSDQELSNKLGTNARVGRSAEVLVSASRIPQKLPWKNHAKLSQYLKPLVFVLVFFISEFDACI